MKFFSLRLIEEAFSITKKRIGDMNSHFVLVREEDKYLFLDKRYSLKNVIYMRDGYYDAKILKDCFLGIAPANARVEAKNAADYVTPSKSGEGAVLDACLYVNNTLDPPKEVKLGVGPMSKEII